MPKAKKSKKQSFSLDDMPKMKLKKGVKTVKDTSVKNLKNKKRVKAALAESLFSDDMASFKEILKAHLDVLNITDLATETGISRKTIYRMLEPDSNPTLKNITKVLNKICA